MTDKLEESKLDKEDLYVQLATVSKFTYFLIRLTQPKITLFTYQHYYITNAKMQSTNDIL